MYCSNCGKELTGDLNYCPNCGSKMNGEVPGGNNDNIGLRLRFKNLSDKWRMTLMGYFIYFWGVFAMALMNTREDNCGIWGVFVLFAIVIPAILFWIWYYRTQIRRKKKEGGSVVTPPPIPDVQIPRVVSTYGLKRFSTLHGKMSKRYDYDGNTRSFFPRFIFTDIISGDVTTVIANDESLFQLTGGEIVAQQDMLRIDEYDDGTYVLCRRSYVEE